MTTIGRILVAVSWIAALVLTTAPALAEKRVALVIGNDRYANLAALQKAVNDAEAVGETLARLGFKVVTGRSLGRQAMIDKIAEFTALLENGDTAVFFYAGHGVAIGGANYLVPSDAPAAASGAEARVRGASIAEGDVIAEIQAKGARVAVLVLDACRDNPFPRAGTRTLGNTRGLADPAPARGVFTIYSAGIGQAALDRLGPNDSNRNSVFTTVFVEQLAKPGLHLAELAVEVREKVATLALTARNDRNQPEPHEQTPAYYDQTIGGRVYLAGRSIAAEPAPSPQAVQLYDYLRRIGEVFELLRTSDADQLTPDPDPLKNKGLIKSAIDNLLDQFPSQEAKSLAYDPRRGGSSLLSDATQTYRQLSLLGDVLDVLRAGNSDPGKDRKLAEAAINGMLRLVPNDNSARSQSVLAALERAKKGHPPYQVVADREIRILFK